MKKITFFTILSFIQLSGFTQTYTMKAKVSGKEKAELLTFAKQVFNFDPDFSYQLSSNDPVKSFSEMEVPDLYDEIYFQKQAKILQADSLSPIANNNLGSYYNFYEQSDSASYFFKKSYENLDIKYFKDSASYLSFQGVLKSNLGKENFIEDIERGLKLNPYDSLGMATYPYLLINNKEFKKVKEFCITHLDNDTSEATYLFVILVTAEVFDGVLSIQNEVNANEKFKERFNQKDYSELFNFKLIDKIANKYKTNFAIRNARYMADIFALLIKTIYFGKSDNNEFSFPHYTPNEKKKLNFLENVFANSMMKKQLNGYAVNKNLGYINFMMQNWDKAILHFNEAIKVFPESKKRIFFNPSEMYDALIIIYYIQKDDSSLRKTLVQKIENEPKGKKDVKDYLLLAKNYYLSDDTKNSEEWANKAKIINSKDFEVLRLLVHLNFLNGNDSLTESYANEALKNIQSKYEQYKIAIQFAIYYLIRGDATTAYNTIKVARESLENETCTLCDNLIIKYIKVDSK